MSIDDTNGPKRKRDHFGGGPSNKRAIMSAMRSMTSMQCFVILKQTLQNL